MNYLIVVDMQNDFISGSLGTKEAEAIVSSVVGKIKEFKGKIIYTKDTHAESYLESMEGKKLPVEHCIKNTDGWQIEKNIRTMIRTGENPVFEKTTFGSVELGEFLKDANQKQKIDTIELIGLCTDICVISNALLLKAYLPETVIKVDSSCCAGVTKESHENALAAMKMCQIEVYGNKE